MQATFFWLRLLFLLSQRQLSAWSTQSLHSSYSTCLRLADLIKIKQVLTRIIIPSFKTPLAQPGPHLHSEVIGPVPCELPPKLETLRLPLD